MHKAISSILDKNSFYFPLNKPTKGKENKLKYLLKELRQIYKWFFKNLLHTFGILLADIMEILLETSKALIPHIREMREERRKQFLQEIGIDEKALAKAMEKTTDTEPAQSVICPKCNSTNCQLIEGAKDFGDKKIISCLDCGKTTIK